MKLRPAGIFLSKCRVNLSQEFKMFSSNMDEVLFEVKNNVGVITLNRPRVLNCLSTSMAIAISSKLKEWQNERSFVIVKGNGKAFCAGGDVTFAVKNKLDAIEFFREIYCMEYLTGTYKIPYVSLIDGITMGGGAGLCIHGNYRIATEKTVFAMPETAIGLFPDVGSSYLLPRLRGKLGMFLALTGYRLGGVDTVKTGIATHFVRSEEIPYLLDKLIDGDADSIDEVLKQNTEDISDEEFSLNPYFNVINSCFEGESVEQIMQNLQKDGSQWSQNILQMLDKASPTSLKVTKKKLDLGASQDLRDSFITDFRLSTAAVWCTISSDFYEGVRALLIDKDNYPKWSPDSLRDISDADVNKCFVPLPNNGDLDI